MASSVIKSKYKALTLTNQATSSDGVLVLSMLPKNITFAPSRLVDDSTNHSADIMAFAVSSGGYPMLMLIDHNTKSIINSTTTISGTLFYFE